MVYIQNRVDRLAHGETLYFLEILAYYFLKFFKVMILKSQ